MQAIVTKIIPATDKKPCRVKASCARGSVVVSVDGPVTDAHRSAALELCFVFIEEDTQRGQPADSNPWAKPFVSGDLKTGEMVHVFVD